jgi:uncharacterized protein
MTKRTKIETRFELGIRADEVHIDRAATGEALAVWIDALRLADARGLIVGNSGAGKSRLARRLLEQAFGKIQMIVLDPEGEFPTLRTEHPFLLAGRSGEVPAEPRSAALLARRVMELGVSTVVDLYDLKLDQQRDFVRNFLDALMELPKELYHPVLVVIDEAHKFCPEGGEAVSADAVIALMSQGRKRGLGGILLTQRFAKLDKDASAEGNNVFVGRVVQDVDQRRAADVLGMPLQQARVALRDLDPGFFYAFGPAFEHKGVALFRAGAVASHHPQAGERHKVKASARPTELARLAEELKDLPQQAAEEIKTLEVARARVRDLERALKAAEKAAPPTAAPAPAKEKPVIKPADLKRLEVASARLEASEGKFTEELRRLADALSQRQQVVVTELGTLATLVAKVQAPAPPAITRAAIVADDTAAARHQAAARAPRAVQRIPAASGVGRGEAAILTAIAQYEDGAERDQLTILTGYKRSTRDAYIQRLASAELIAPYGSRFKVTSAGLAVLGPGFQPLPTGAALRAYWIGDGSSGGALPKGERDILAVVIEHHPNAVDRDAISERTGFKRSTRDAYLRRLANRRLVVSDRGPVRAAATLFEER